MIAIVPNHIKLEGFFASGIDCDQIKVIKRKEIEAEVIKNKNEVNDKGITNEVVAIPTNLNNNN